MGILVAALAAVSATDDASVVTMMAVSYCADSIVDRLQPKAVSLLTKPSEVVTTALA